jgi:hypothetical protein
MNNLTPEEIDAIIEQYGVDKGAYLITLCLGMLFRFGFGLLVGFMLFR